MTVDWVRAVTHGRQRWSCILVVGFRGVDEGGIKQRDVLC